MSHHYQIPSWGNDWAANQGLSGDGYLSDRLVRLPVCNSLTDEDTLRYPIHSFPSRISSFADTALSLYSLTVLYRGKLFAL